MDHTPLLSMNLTYWVFQTIAMMVTALLIPKLKVTGPLGAFTTVVALAFVNSKIWDAALFFKIPDNFSTQALVLFLANGIIFWVLIKILPGIEVEGIVAALIAPVVFTFCSLVIAEVAPLIDWVAVLEFTIDLLQELKEFLQEVPASKFSEISSAGK